MPENYGHNTGQGMRTSKPKSLQQRPLDRDPLIPQFTANKNPSIPWPFPRLSFDLAYSFPSPPSSSRAWNLAPALFPPDRLLLRRLRRHPPPTYLRKITLTKSVCRPRSDGTRRSALSRLRTRSTPILPPPKRPVQRSPAPDPLAQLPK